MLRSYGILTEINKNLRRNFIEQIKAPIFLGSSLSNKNHVKIPIHLRRETKYQHLKKRFFFKNRPIHFHINSTGVNLPVKQNKLSFSCVEINGVLLVPVQSIS